MPRPISEDMYSGVAAARSRLPRRMVAVSPQSAANPSHTAGTARLPVT